MFRLFRKSVPVVVVAASLAVGAEGQPQDREFGWSLTISPAARKRTEGRPAAPRREQSTEEEGEIRVDTQLVLSDVLVQDKNGNPVAGLIAADFEITENGSPQAIDIFALGDSAVPRSIILVIDHSLSQWDHIERSISAAKVLVDSLRPADRMSIVSDDVTLISDLTSDKEVLKNSLESLKRKCNEGRFGKSYQYSALYAVLNERVTRNGTRNIVIFQTDGDELATLNTGISLGSKRFGLDDIVEVAKRKGVTIYSIFTGLRYVGLSKDEKIEKTKADFAAQMKMVPTVVPQPTRSTGRSRLSNDYLLARASRITLDEAAVAALAERSGGFAQALESPDQAAGIYERILSEIDRRYVVGYYPPDRPYEGSREREVRIRLRKKGSHRVIGGRTYVSY